MLLQHLFWYSIMLHVYIFLLSLSRISLMWNLYEWFVICCVGSGAEWQRQFWRSLMNAKKRWDRQNRTAKCVWHFSSYERTDIENHRTCSQSHIGPKMSIYSSTDFVQNVSHTNNVMDYGQNLCRNTCGLSCNVSFIADQF